MSKQCRTCLIRVYTVYHSFFRVYTVYHSFYIFWTCAVWILLYSLDDVWNSCEKYYNPWLLSKFPWWSRQWICIVIVPSELYWQMRKLIISRLMTSFRNQAVAIVGKMVQSTGLRRTVMICSVSNQCHMSLVTRKPVFAVCDQVRLKPLQKLARVLKFSI